MLKDPKEVFKTVNRFLGIQITDGKRFRKLHLQSLFWIFNCSVPSVLEESFSTLCILLINHCWFLEVSRKIVLSLERNLISLLSYRTHPTNLSLSRLVFVLFSLVTMNALKLSFTMIVLLLNPFSNASFVPLLKEGLDELSHLFNTRHSLTSILFPDPVESKNITIKLGFIGALDKSLGATASLGQELVSLLPTESYNSFQYSMLSSG